MVDQERIAGRMAADRVTGYELDREAAEASLQAGQSLEELDGLYPHLEIDVGGVRVRPEARESVARDRSSHLNQYRWEGGFFLAVLAAGVLVLWGVLRREADLLSRQQNFLAAVSHELRSPLASLRLTTETLLLRDLAAADRPRAARPQPGGSETPGADDRQSPGDEPAGAGEGRAAPRTGRPGGGGVPRFRRTRAPERRRRGPADRSQDRGRPRSAGRPRGPGYGAPET